MTMLDHWMNELTGLNTALNGWEPKDPASERIKANVADFIERLDDGVGRLAVEMEARQAEEAQLEIALCHIEDAVSVTNRQGEIRLINPAFERLTGYGAQMIGRPHEPLWDQTNASVLADMKRAMDGGAVWRGEVHLRAKSGAELIVDITVGPIVNLHGEITHYVFTQRDVTARVNAEKRARAQSVFLEKLLNLTPNVILALGPDGKIWLDNLAAKTLIADMGPDGRERLAERLLAGLEKGMARPWVISMERARGGMAWYSLHAERIPANYLIPDSDAKSLNLVTMTDVTELERKNQEIVIRQKAIASLQREREYAREEMANGLVYRMIQPLNVARAIQSRLVALAGECGADGMGDSITLLGEQLRALETDLKEFRKVSPRSAPANGTCRAGEILRSLEVLYAERAGADDVKLDIGGAPPGLAARVPEDVALMVAALVMDNAFDAVAKTAQRVAAARIGETREGEWEFIVEDGGPGVKESEVYRIFEPFHTTKPGRQGLSLALVAQMLNKNGGRIEVGRSALGGAQFIITFPQE